MTDYIKREDAIRIARLQGKHAQFDGMAQDVAPVRHGRWEVVDAEEPRRYGCSECKRLSWHMENYCGNCGADMRGEQDG